MPQTWLIALILTLLCGCGDHPDRMDRAEDPRGRYREQIEAARRVLAQQSDWADRAEWEVIPTSEGWKVIAWRVEHPDRKGSERYLPWGCSIIELDRRNVAIHYHAKG